MAELPAATLRFLEAAGAVGLPAAPVVFPEGTKTAAQAATAVGCEPAAIVKLLVFMAGDAPVLVLMAGDRRVDEERLAEVAGAPVRRATLDEVRRHTGYAAGGTPPVGHATPMTAYVDRSLQRNEDVWAAGGTPTTVFPVKLTTLVRVTGAMWVEVAAG